MKDEVELRLGNKPKPGLPETFNIQHRTSSERGKRKNEEFNNKDVKAQSSAGFSSFAALLLCCSNLFCPKF